MTALLASAARCHFSVEGVPKSGLAIYNNVRPFNAKAAPFVARPKSSAEVLGYWEQSRRTIALGNDVFAHIIKVGTRFGKL